MTLEACCCISKRWRCTHYSFNVRITRLIITFCLREVRPDDVLTKAVAAHDAGVSPRSERPTIIRPQKERPIDASQTAKACDQRSLDCSSSSCLGAASPELPTEKLSRVTADHQTRVQPRSLLNRIGKSLLHPQSSVNERLIHRTPRNIEAKTKLRQRNRETVFSQPRYI